MFDLIFMLFTLVFMENNNNNNTAEWKSLLLVPSPPTKKMHFFKTFALVSYSMIIWQ